MGIFSGLLSVFDRYLSLLFSFVDCWVTGLDSAVFLEMKDFEIQVLFLLVFVHGNDYRKRAFHNIVKLSVNTNDSVFCQPFRWEVLEKQFCFLVQNLQIPLVFCHTCFLQKRKKPKELLLKIQPCLYSIYYQKCKEKHGICDL